MPTYEYRCKSCRHQFDAVQSFTDDALTECPECGGLVKKVFGSVGITFKGSGFYKTDSRSGASKGEGGDSATEKSGEKVTASKDSGGSSDTASNSSGSDSKSSESKSSKASGSGETGKSGSNGKDAKKDRAGAAKGSTSAPKSGSGS